MDTGSPPKWAARTAPAPHRHRAGPWGRRDLSQAGHRPGDARSGQAGPDQADRGRQPRVHTEAASGTRTRLQGPVLAVSLALPLSAATTTAATAGLIVMHLAVAAVVIP